MKLDEHDQQVPRKRDYTREELLEWAREQQRAYKRGELSPRQIKKLEATPGWTWD